MENQKIKLSVMTAPSELRRHYSINVVDDMGIPLDTWRKMSKAEKEEAIDNYVQDMPEQPYWCCDQFEEVETES